MYFVSKIRNTYVLVESKSPSISVYFGPERLHIQNLEMLCYWLVQAAAELKNKKQ